MVRSLRETRDRTVMSLMSLLADIYVRRYRARKYRRPRTAVSVIQKRAGRTEIQSITLTDRRANRCVTHARQARFFRFDEFSGAS
jgi:hypothetical protein